MSDTGQVPGQVPEQVPEQAPHPAAAPPPRRLPRTTGGLIGSMIVVVVLVLGFVVFRSLFRHQTPYEHDHINYTEAVGDAQGVGRMVVYPRSLPKGWYADSITFDPTGRLRWGLGILTKSGSFVGIAQQDESVARLLSESGLDSPDQGSDYTATGSVATTWTTWSDSDGDHAYSTTLDGATVLVYGSADPADQQQLLPLLTIEAIPGGQSASPSPP